MGRFAMGRSVGHGLGWLEFFEEVPEPRQKAKVLYPLSELLLCCLVGVLCGAEGWVEVEEYGEAKLDFLRRFLPFAHGIASHDTFSDVFNALDRERFKVAFIAWAAALQENVREIVAIDGKTLRRSFDRGGGQGPIHMISAWAAGQRLVLGQLAVGAKDNEITAIPELLALLSLKGAIVTIDAIGCQKKIAAVIRDRGADYLLALKDNQPTLHRDVADFLREQRAAGFKDCAAGSWATHETTDADRAAAPLRGRHGRLEIRRHWIVGDIAWLRERHPRWPDLTSIGMIEAVREQPGKPASCQTRFYIGSIAPDAIEFAHAARQHWSIEWFDRLTMRRPALGSRCHLARRRMPHPKTQWSGKLCHHPAHDAEPPPAHKNRQEKEHPRQARPRRSRRNVPPSRPHGRMIPSSDSPGAPAPAP
jgi:predicted transposase YbfD/YdcC